MPPRARGLPPSGGQGGCGLRVQPDGGERLTCGHGRAKRQTRRPPGVGAGGKLHRRERSYDLSSATTKFTTDYTFDVLDRNTSVAHTRTGSTTVRNFGYTWGTGTGTSKLFERATFSATGGASPSSFSFGYDKLHRLTSSVKNSQATSFNYDAAHSRTSVVEGSGTTTYTLNSANQIVQTSGPGGTVGYGYDGAGNRVTKTGGGYSYNYRNQVVTVSKTSPAVTTSFRYDALGRKVAEERTEGGSTAITHL